MSYGLLSTGFVAKTLPVIRDEINTAIRGYFGASLDMSDRSPLGQFAGIFAEREALLWELLEAVYLASDPDAATGNALAVLCSITGTIPNPARASTVTLTLTGTPATIVPSGSRAQDPSTLALFATDASATLATLTAWAISTAYAIGDRRTNASRAYECITAGTSAGAGGPTTSTSDITDGTVHWRYLGEGTGAVDAEATCTVTGPTVAVADAISEIDTPVSGWTSVKNLLDADVGADEEADEILRPRRALELASAGGSTDDAIRAEVLQIDGVTACTVFSNRTDTTDSEGRPPHSFEVLVQGGEDQDIWDTILANLPAGSASYGLEAGTSDDSQGVAQDVYFSRPDEVEIYIIANVDYDADEYPVDGDDQIKAAIVAWGDTLKAGRNAVAAGVSAQVFTIAGVLDVEILIDDAPAPASSATVSIGAREIAVYDTSRITVNSSAATP